MELMSEDFIRYRDFSNTISIHEVYPYTHIMSIPSSSFQYAQLLLPEQWYSIFQYHHAIALRCYHDGFMSFVFSSQYFRIKHLKNNQVNESGIVTLNIQKLNVEVEFPAEDNEAWFTHKQESKGSILISM
jgi:hypothetical protein